MGTQAYENHDGPPWHPLTTYLWNPIHFWPLYSTGNNTLCWSHRNTSLFMLRVNQISMSGSVIRKKFPPCSLSECMRNLRTYCDKEMAFTIAVGSYHTVLYPARSLTLFTIFVLLLQWTQMAWSFIIIRMFVSVSRFDIRSSVNWFSISSQLMGTVPAPLRPRWFSGTMPPCCGSRLDLVGAAPTTYFSV